MRQAQKQKLYYIQSVDAENKVQLFWNNNTGWGNIADANMFTEKEKQAMSLPLGGEWVEYEETVEGAVKCEGTCPVCGVGDPYIDYDGPDVEGEYGTYNCRCEVCNTSFEEHYNLVYQQTVYEKVDESAKGKLTYVQGDATLPQGEGTKIIVHCCNDESKWGAGFVIALNKRFGEGENSPKDVYLKNMKRRSEAGKNILGQISIAGINTDDVNENLYVINMIGQHETINTNPEPLGDGEGLKVAMGKVADYMETLRTFEKISIHCPKFGAGLAGGDFNEIEKWIKAIWIDQGIDVTIYEYMG